MLRGARTEARKELKTGDRELLQAAMTKIFMGSGSKKIKKQKQNFIL